MHSHIQRENRNSGRSCALRTGKLNFPLRMRTLEKLTFRTSSRPSQTVHSMHSYEKQRLQNVREDATTRLGYASASLSRRLESTIACAANFTHWSRITLTPHLLDNILLYKNPTLLLYPSAPQLGMPEDDNTQF